MFGVFEYVSFFFWLKNVLLVVSAVFETKKKRERLVEMMVM